MENEKGSSNFARRAICSTPEMLAKRAKTLCFMSVERPVTFRSWKVLFKTLVAFLSKWFSKTLPPYFFHLYFKSVTTNVVGEGNIATLPLSIYSSQIKNRKIDVSICKQGRKKGLRNVYKVCRHEGRSFTRSMLSAFRNPSPRLAWRKKVLWRKRTNKSAVSEWNNEFCIWTFRTSKNRETGIEAV